MRQLPLTDRDAGFGPFERLGLADVAVWIDSREELRAMLHADQVPNGSGVVRVAEECDPERGIEVGIGSAVAIEVACLKVVRPVGMRRASCA